MQRRNVFRAALAAVAGVAAGNAAAPIAPAPQKGTVSPRLALALALEAGVPIVGGMAALVDVAWGAELAGQRVMPWADIPTWATVSTVNLTGARLDDAGWLHADDCVWPNVIGNAVLVAIGLALADGSRWLVGVGDSQYFFGLPLTPRGGNVAIVWPRSPGIVKVAL